MADLDADRIREEAADRLVDRAISAVLADQGPDDVVAELLEASARDVDLLARAHQAAVAVLERSEREPLRRASDLLAAARDAAPPKP